MRSYWFRLVIGVLILGAFSSFQNCAPSNVAYSDAPAETKSVTETAPPATTDASVAAATVKGSVTNALTNAPLAGVAVRVRNAATPSEIAATLTTSATGTFQSGALAPGNYFVDFALAGYITVTNIPAVLEASKATVLNQSLSTVINNDQFRIVLNWCDPKSSAAEDVDAYMKYPTATDPIYFNSRNGDGLKLDIDILHWKGPETVTISTLKSGTYVYYVNNYSNRSNAAALGNSDVKVAVYRGSVLLKLYTVPVGSGITYEVFRIVDGNLVDVQKYNDSLPIAY